MPSAVTVNGVTTRRPGVLADPNVSALSSRALTTNVLAVVGDFPWLEQAEPARYSNGNDILTDAPVGHTLAAWLAKFIFAPAADDRVSGHPSAVYLVNAATVGQAQLMVLDGSANNAALLKSKTWGLDGNKAVVEITANAVDATLRDLRVELNGDVQTMTRLGSGVVFTLTYTGTDATDITLDVNQGATDYLKVLQERAGLSGAFVPSEGRWLWDGIVTATPSGATAGGDGTLAVAGIKKDGTADTENITLPSGLSAPVAGTTEWSYITSLTYTPSASGGETCTASGAALAVDAAALATFPNLSVIADYLNNFSGQGYAATKVLPSLAKIPLESVDVLAAADATAGADVRADLWAFVDAVNKRSKFLTATQQTAGVGQVVATTSTNLAGGTYTAPTDSNYDSCFTELRLFDIQTIALMSSSQGAMEFLRAHCAYMAGEGSGERDAYVGASSEETFANLKTLARALNTRHLGLVSQDFKLRAPDGVVRQYAPYYGAVLMAAAQCSTPVGTPLTRKRLNVVDVVTHTSWNADSDAEECLENGLTILTRDRLGLRIERSLTTYLTDDNPVYSEKSANESFNTCIRDLRQNLETLIGEPAFDATRARIQALAKARLRYQVQEGIIKAFDEPSLVVDDLGDVFRVRCKVAVTEPTNFIIIEPTVERTPFGQ